MTSTSDQLFNSALSIEGFTLLRMSELKQQLEMRLPDDAFTYEEIKAVVELPAGPGAGSGSLARRAAVRPSPTLRKKVQNTLLQSARFMPRVWARHFPSVIYGIGIATSFYPR